MSKGAKTKAKIVNAAIRLFAKNGYAETSLEKVARACGLTQGALFHHFKSKSELVAEILSTITSHNREQVTSLMQKNDDARTRLQRHFEGNIRWAIESPDEAQIILFLYYLACSQSEFRHTYREVRLAAVGRIEECLYAAQRERLLKDGVKIEDSAKLLHDVLVGSFVNLLAVEKSPKLQSLNELQARWQPLFDQIFSSQN